MWVLALAIVIVLVVVAVVALAVPPKREGMAVSPEARAIHAKASELFDRRGPRVSYTEYRRAVPRADPVQFSDTWSLYREGRLTPAAVQSQVLA